MNNAMQGHSAVGKRDDEQDKVNSGLAANQMPMQAVDAVGRKLKASYDRMLREPIPDKLMQLLDELDQAERRSGDERGDRQDSGGSEKAHGNSLKGEE